MKKCCPINGKKSLNTENLCRDHVEYYLHLFKAKDLSELHENRKFRKLMREYKKIQRMENQLGGVK